MLPVQVPQNNRGGCFNWFRAEHTRRDSGEAMSIRQMVRTAQQEFGADRQRVFQPFQRLGDARSRGGVGLGLAVARGFTEAVGGDLLLLEGSGHAPHARDPVEPGQAIRVPPLPEAPAPSSGAGKSKTPRARPQDVALLRDAVLYRDDWAIVVNKPAGLAVQGGTNTERHVDALLDGLRFDSAERPRLVHRLDKDTSGVLLIARNAAAAAFFTRAFRDKTTRKIYWAIVVGLPQLRQGRIDLALSRSPAIKKACTARSATKAPQNPSPSWNIASVLLGANPCWPAACSAPPVMTKTCCALGAHMRNVTPPGAIAAPIGVSRPMPSLLVGIADLHSVVAAEHEQHHVLVGRIDQPMQVATLQQRKVTGL